MRKLISRLVAAAPLFGGFSLLPHAASAQTDTLLVGAWQGALQVPGGGSLRIVLHISPAEGGGLRATLDSPDQGATGILASSVRHANDSLIVEIASIGGRYEGRIEASAQRLSGMWKQGGTSLQLDPDRVSDTSTLLPKRPQEPKPPFPYGVEEVTFVNARDSVSLAGTLTLPAGRGPHPGVVLISGSGPQNRDEEIFGHKPFLVLADHLARNGIAVLRYDDRGFGGSTGDFSTATSEDFARDASAALRFLAAHPQIDPEQVGLVGHSEGAMIAPMIASTSDSVAFLVLLAGPGVPGNEIIAEQSVLIQRASGVPEEAIAKATEDQKNAFALLMQPPSPAVEDSLRAMLIRGGVPAEAIEAQLAQFTSPWMRFFLSHDPLPALRATRVPVLALFGEKDLQVPPAQSAAPMEAALKARGAIPYEVIILPHLNHLFQTATLGTPAEYGRIEETMAPAALKTILDWIATQAGLEEAP